MHLFHLDRSSCAAALVILQWNRERTCVIFSWLCCFWLDRNSWSETEKEAGVCVCVWRKGPRLESSPSCCSKDWVWYMGYELSQMSRWYRVSLKNAHLLQQKHSCSCVRLSSRADSFQWPVAFSACLQLEAHNFYFIPIVHCNTFSSLLFLLFFKGNQFCFHSLHFFSEQAVYRISCELQLLPFEIML